jgi:RNA polymerase sigma-70 factor (ECF subfamily)
MPDDPDFDDLMGRLGRGDQAAAEELFRRYARRLIGLARRHLDGRLRQKVDPEDILQSVFQSFFLRQAAGEYDLDSWDSLWSLLTVITLRKCGYRTRHFRTARRDVQRETSPPPANADDSGADWQAIAREPTPDEAALLGETVAQLFRGLDERERRVAELSLQGYKGAEISARAGVAERTVYRLLERLRGKLQRLAAEDGSAG